MITLTEAKNLKLGQILVDDLNGKRWKVNGQVKVWKTRPADVRIPVKHGLYKYGYVTQEMLDTMTLETR